MSIDAAMNFVQQCHQDTQLWNKVEQAKTPDEVTDLANNAGFNITPEHMKHLLGKFNTGSDDFGIVTGNPFSSQDEENSLNQPISKDVLEMKEPSGWGSGEKKKEQISKMKEAAVKALENIGESSEKAKAEVKKLMDKADPNAPTSWQAAKKMVKDVNSDCSEVYGLAMTSTINKCQKAVLKNNKFDVSISYIKSHLFKEMAKLELEKPNASTLSLLEQAGTETQKWVTNQAAKGKVPLSSIINPKTGKKLNPMAQLTPFNPKLLTMKEPASFAAQQHAMSEMSSAGSKMLAVAKQDGLNVDQLKGTYSTAYIQAKKSGDSDFKAEQFALKTLHTSLSKEVHTKFKAQLLKDIKSLYATMKEDGINWSMDRLCRLLNNKLVKDAESGNIKSPLKMLKIATTQTKNEIVDWAKFEHPTGAELPSHSLAAEGATLAIKTISIFADFLADA